MSAVPCLGCGILSATHKWVAVLNPGDKDTVLPEGVPHSVPGPNGFVAFSVCDECHRNPEHRVRPIKGHFFRAEDAPTAIFHAGTPSVKM